MGRFKAHKRERTGWFRPVLVISQTRTLSVERLSSRITSLPIESLDQIIDGLHEIVGQ